MSPGQVLKKPKVVVMGRTEYGVHDDDVAEFDKEFDVSVLDTHSRKEAMERLSAMVQQGGPVDALIIRAGTDELGPFNEELLKPLVPSCRIVASASADYDDMDISWMTANNMWFCNTAEGAAEATADMAMLLILAVVRDAFRAERGARSGSWRVGQGPGRDPSGMTLGIVGMGRVGKHLARKAAALQMRVKYHSRRRLSIDDEAAYSAHYCGSLHELLAQADVTSIHVPQTAQTARLISTPEFEAIKDGAFFVNTARGAVVDEAALLAALESGNIARAGLDVFCHEPHISEALRRHERVVCIPRLSAATDEAFRRGERECLDKVRACLKTGRPMAPENEPTPVTERLSDLAADK